jgi:argininosuccinate lyase
MMPKTRKKTSSKKKARPTPPPRRSPALAHPKAWSGRLPATDPAVEQFTASLPVDRRLYTHDITGSIAHSQALHEAGLLSEQEAEQIRAGLTAIEEEIRHGRFVFTPADEDIHMAVERRLIERIGPAGAKLHTGRSRNDQVALDLRLYLREEATAIMGLVRALQQALVRQAKAHLGIPMPGYTHLQRAQPVLLSHHWLAYHDMLERDYGRFNDGLKRALRLPLGSGALAGTNYAISRKRLAELLGFPAVTTNSLDAVSDRDFIIEFLSASALLMTHLSRLGEELVIWSSQEFGFIELPESFCTGSSMMPQKKNPDVAELVRGKSGRVFGALVALLTLLKGLPLSYNRDLQEDKPPFFDAADTVKSVLVILVRLLPGVIVHRERLERAAGDSLLLATDLADYLALKGVPFRQAHAIVGQVVRYALERKKALTALSPAEWRRFSKQFGSDLKPYLSLEQSLARKAQQGATAMSQVAVRIKELEQQ